MKLSPLELKILMNIQLGVMGMVDMTVQNNYHIRGIFGGDFNLAVWRFFVCPPNLNNANIAS